MEPPPPPSYNDAITNPEHYTSSSIDVDDEAEDLVDGSSVDPGSRTEGVVAAENEQFDAHAESNPLINSEDATQGDRDLEINSNLSFSEASQYRVAGGSSVHGEPPYAEPSSISDAPLPTGEPSSMSDAPQQTGETLSSSQTPPHTEPPSMSDAPPHTRESQLTANGSLSVSGTSSHSGESQFRMTIIPSAPPSESIETEPAQNQPPPPSYDEAFMRPGQTRNIMQTPRAPLSGAHRNPMAGDLEQPPPSYSSVLNSQGSQYHNPMNAQTFNSSYATNPTSATAGLIRYQPGQTYGSSSHGSYNNQGYQRMPHVDNNTSGSYVVHNVNQPSGYTAPLQPTGTSGNVQGYNTTPLAYVDPHATPREKTNTYTKLCLLCFCTSFIFIISIVFLKVMIFN